MLFNVVNGFEQIKRKLAGAECAPVRLWINLRNEMARRVAILVVRERHQERHGPDIPLSMGSSSVLANHSDHNSLNIDIGRIDRAVFGIRRL